MLLAAGVALVLWGAAAHASPESEMRTKVGREALAAQQYQAALVQFQQAVAADRNDWMARYYRGVAEARLNDWTAAEADLRAVVAAQPKFAPAQLQLGIVLVQRPPYEDAVPFLKEAQKSPETDAEASLYLGVAQLRLGQLDAAADSLKRAGRAANLQLPVAYYSGVVAYRLGHWDEAETNFEKVIATSPDSDMGHEASAFLTRLRGSERPFQLYGEVAFQYDSNVTLEPTSDAVAANAGFTTRQSDGSSVLRVGGGYAPLQTGDMQLLVGYEFYQSLYFNLDQFNLQDHRPSAQFIYRHRWLSLGLATRYDYFLLGGDSYFQGINALPFANAREGDFGSTELYFRYRWREYFKPPFRGRLDSNIYSPGVIQRFFLGSPERYVSLGYRYDGDVPIEANGAPFGYDANEVSGGINWTVPQWLVDGEFVFTYRHEDYDRASLGRQDDQYLFTVLVERPITRYLYVVAAYLGAINNSTKSEFEYTRNIGSLGVEVRY